MRGMVWKGLRWLCGTLLLAAAAQAQAIPGFDAVRADFHPSETVLLDRAGQPIHRLRTDARVRRGQWVALQGISPALRQALVLSEDKRFYEHSGVDWRAVSSAAWANLWNQRTRGASTLTMQLAGLLDDDLALGTGGRTLRQKIGQAVMATRLEAGWQKSQILEAYLNLVPFRGELVGIDALSRTLFAKAPHGLQDTEAAIAAALVRAPNARPALVAQRACGVLKAMRGPGAATDCVALDMQTAVALARRAFAASEGIAPHVARRLAAAQGGDAPATLPSTLDAGLQRLAQQTLQQHIRELHGRNVEDGAVVVLDNASGEVLAWVGSTGELSRAAEVDGVTAPRQPGSTLKPFLYAQAIAERRLTAASLLHDSPAHLQTASGLYIPQNYDRQFKGWVSARTALAASLNVPAVRTLVMVSPEPFARQLGALGIVLKEGGGYYGYSLALGSAEVNLLQLTNAYRALANRGQWCEARLQPPALLPRPSGERAGVRGGAVAREAAPPSPASGRGRESGCRPALNPAAAFIVTDILADPNARARTFGTDSILSTRFWTAVKTGTSKDMRDNWAVGWSERYTVGVWVGNASGAPMHDVSGTSGAAPVWAELMAFLHANEPSRAPAPPPGLRRQAVRFGPAPQAGRAQAVADAAPLEAAREEWFLPGTEQALFTPARLLQADDARAAPDGSTPVRSVARIVTPADGTLLALDPDIPPRHQRVRFEADGVAASPEARRLQWRIDGKTFARGTQAQWLPWPGRHTVELADARGQVLHSIRLEVRGAGVAPPQAPVGGRGPH